MRGAVPTTDYMHFFLELVFLRYLSSAFDRKHADLLDTPHADAEYQADNVFWMPREARWGTLQGYARSSYVGKRLDDAMVAIERDNPRLKGVLPKDYARPGLDKQRLGELIDVIATISLTAASEGEKTHRSVDLLGRVYDWSGATKTAVGSPKGERGAAHQYFLTRFASAEGKNGGHSSGARKTAKGSPQGERGGVHQFYTPSCVVRCLVEMLAPYKGRIYDPACGSGGMFVQSEKFVESHGGSAMARSALSFVCCSLR
jgi:type I restriction enzyme M protein